MAKRYTFRFETLLRVRKQREEEEKRVVASRLREIRQLEQRQEALVNRINEHTDLARQAMRNQMLDLEHLKLGRSWVVRLRRGVLETQAEITKNRAILAQERSRLAEAAKQRKVLDKLKEKRRERFLFEEARREQAEYDEMNVQRFARLSLVDGGDIA